MGTPIPLAFLLTLSTLLLPAQTAPAQRAAVDDEVRLRDGTLLQGLVSELGGNSIEILVGGVSKKILKGDIETTLFNAARPATAVEASDAVVNKAGHTIRGTVDLLDGGQKVRVTLPSGGQVFYPRQEVLKIVRKGDAVTHEAMVFTAELGKAIEEAVRRLEKGADTDAEMTLVKAGVFAIDRVRKALGALAPGAAGSAALARVARVYHLKEIIAPPIEESEPKCYEILGHGAPAEKLNLLMFVFPRFVDESVPLAEMLATDETEDPTVRAWSVDFLRRMQRNRELLRIYKRSSGKVQFATAVALGQNRILVGVPAILDALELESLEARTTAARTLVEITGQDFKFVADGAPQARREAIARWRAWWQKSEAEALRVATNLIKSGDSALPGEAGAPTAERLDATQLWKKASAAAEVGHLEEAEKLLRQAVDRDSTFFQPHLALAVILYAHLNRGDDAIRLLETLATRRFPGQSATDRQWIFVHLGNARRLKGDLAGAVRAYDDALGLAPQNLHALLGQVDTTFQLATGKAEMTPEDRKEKLKQSLACANRALEAIDKLSEGLVAIGVDSVALAGELPFDRREYNRSVIKLRQGYRRDKKELTYKKAKILSLLGEKKEAALALRSAIDGRLLEGGDDQKKLEADIRCFLGLLYEDLGQPLAALGEYRKVLKELAPEHPECQRGVERLRQQAQGKAGN